MGFGCAKKSHRFWCERTLRQTAKSVTVVSGSGEVVLDGGPFERKQLFQEASAKQFQSGSSSFLKALFQGL